jgi:Tol biopolymer transport system component
MITLDEPAVPDRTLHELREEAARHSVRFRRRRLTRSTALAGTAVAVVIGMVVASAGPPAPLRTTQTAGVAEGDGPPSDAPAGEGPGATAEEAIRQVPSWSDTRSLIPAPPVAAIPEKGPSTPSAAPLTKTAGKVLFLRDFSFVFEANADGTGVREVYRGDGYGWRWSPDGKRLLYTYDGDLFTVELATKTRSVLFEGRTGDSAGEGAWMPDGRSVVFWRNVGITSRSFELTLLDGSTGELTRLHQSSESSSGPAVSADGRIAFGCKVTYYEPRLCLTDRRGTNLGFVPNSTYYAHYAWSPDGKWIAATDWAGGSRSTGTVVFRPDGTDRKVVINDRTAFRPAWFPDSSRVVFSLLPHDPLDPPSNDGCTVAPCPADTGVWSARLDGSDARPITDGAKDILFDARER